MKKVYESPIMEVAFIRQQVMLSVSPGYDNPERIGFDDDEEGEGKEPID